eukprot:11165702-Lingulodinium_polyedra.AAC.1
MRCAHLGSGGLMSAWVSKTSGLVRAFWPLLKKHMSAKTSPEEACNNDCKNQERHTLCQHATQEEHALWTHAAIAN